LNGLARELNKLGLLLLGPGGVKKPWGFTREMT